MFGREKNGDMLAREEQVLMREMYIRIDREELARQINSTKQATDYECEWHNDHERKVLELAKLDAEITAKEQTFRALKETFDLVIVEKDGVISNQQDTIESLIEVAKTAVEHQEITINK